MLPDVQCEEYHQKVQFREVDNSHVDLLLRVEWREVLFQMKKVQHRVQPEYIRQ